MMRCETCSHECTIVDFVTFRNVCEHLYLDSLAKKSNPFMGSTSRSMYCGNGFQGYRLNTVESRPVGPELMPLK